MSLLSKESGLQGAEASTAMRNIMLELQDPAKASSKAIKELGIESTDIVEVFKQLATKGDAGSEAIKQFDKAKGICKFWVCGWKLIYNIFQHGPV